MSIQPTHLDTLRMLMHAAMMRQQAIGQNIANVNTPGYHRLDVHFEEQLSQVLGNDPNANVNAVSPQIYEVENLPERSDGNNVDIDQELGALSKNALLYQVYAQVLSSKMRTMQSAIRGQA